MKIPPRYKHQDFSLAHARKSNLMFDMSDPGTGKTRVQIDAFAERRRKNGKKALILATKSLLDSAWKRDFQNYAPDMVISLAYASNRKQALAAKCDVVVTNHDAAKDLIKLPATFWAEFDTLIIDESTAFKHHTSQRSKAVAKLARHFRYRTCMTGTPTSNGICDIWHQVYILDEGQLLGKSFFGFRSSVCEPKQIGPVANMIKWEDREGADLAVATILEKITVRHQFDDCVDIPENLRYAVPFTLPKTLQAKYDDMQDYHFVELKKTGVTAVNGAVVYGKLLQIACLAGGTEVFTNYGWKPIETITNQDQLWDGIEWVNSYGSTCSGYTTVIECDGVAMTHDHKVLTTSGWVTAKEIQNGNAYGRFDRETVRPPDGFETLWSKQQKEYSVVNAVSVRKSSSSYWLKLKEWKSSISKIMRVQPQSSITTSQRYTSSKSNSDVLPMGEHQITMQQSKGQRLQKLWRAGNNCMQSMGKIFREFSCRYGTDIQSRFNFRSQEQQQRIFQNELCVAYCAGTVQQHPCECVGKHFQGKDDCYSSGARIQTQTDNYLPANSQRQQRYSSTSKVAVYDILNSGPRHRFVVRGNTGKIFVVHNSGAVYNDDGEYSLLDSSRYSLILDLVEERAHSIVFFSWEHQRDELIREAEKRGISYEVFDGSTSVRRRTSIVQDYQEGKYQVLFAHPQSAGHGLTLTKGTATIWASPTYNLEHFLQGLKRIHRIGQNQKTETIVIVAEGTIDEVVWEVLQAKDAKQGDLLKLLKAEVTHDA